jgi:NADPH2:quinone reductase
LKGAQLLAFNLGPFFANEPEEAARNQRELLDLFFSGRLRPHVDSVHPLANVAQALERVAGRQAIGKVLVVT